jgi:hypothetical protein
MHETAKGISMNEHSSTHTTTLLTLYDGHMVYVLENYKTMLQ